MNEKELCSEGRFDILNSYLNQDRKKPFTLGELIKWAPKNIEHAGSNYKLRIKHELTPCEVSYFSYEANEHYMDEIVRAMTASDAMACCMTWLIENGFTDWDFENCEV